MRNENDCVYMLYPGQVQFSKSRNFVPIDSSSLTEKMDLDYYPKEKKNKNKSSKK
jgi:hypothetical protein